MASTPSPLSTPIISPNTSAASSISTNAASPTSTEASKSPVSPFVPSSMPVTISINGIGLPINPQQVTETLPRSVGYTQTLVGTVRNDFGNGVRSWTIQGHTGHGGGTSLQQLKALEAPVGVPQSPVAFAYPWKYGIRAFNVYVDDVTWTESVADGTFSFHYQILLREVMPAGQQPPIINTSSL